MRWHGQQFPGCWSVMRCALTGRCGELRTGVKVVHPARPSLPWSVITSSRIPLLERPDDRLADGRGEVSGKRTDALVASGSFARFFFSHAQLVDPVDPRRWTPFGCGSSSWFPAAVFL